jgi:predicted DNA-binding ribbon-helix-helix protein
VYDRIRADEISDAIQIQITVKFFPEVKMNSVVVKRSIVIGGHKTSVSLEEPFWLGLKEIAGDRQATLSSVVSDIDVGRQEGNLSSAIRLFVLEAARMRAAIAPAAAMSQNAAA